MMGIWFVLKDECDSMSEKSPDLLQLILQEDRYNNRHVL